MKGLPLMLLVSASNAAHAAPDTAALEGLWQYRTTLGDAAPVTLRISGKSGQWALQANDHAVRSESLNFSIEALSSSFRGSLCGPDICGMWHQPPGLPGQAYATPVILKRKGQIWAGEVQPLPQHFTLLAQIKRNGDTWNAVFRNKEYNLSGNAPSFSLSMDSSGTLTFQPANGGRGRDGRYDVAHDTISVAWPPLPGVVTLSRTSKVLPADAAPSPTPVTGYVVPEKQNDGWSVARAGSVGFSEKVLDELLTSLGTIDPFAPKASLIHSILVARHGRLVLERYFYDFTAETPHDLRSGGKTLSSVLLGAAMLRDARLSVENSIADFAPAKSLVTPRPWLRDIRLRHLLTHSSGLACDDNDDASPGNENVMQGQPGEPDWWTYTLQLDKAFAPGVRYAYCSASINLVGAAISSTVQQPIPEAFDRLIARPMHFGRYHWNLMPNGEGYLGGGVYLRPRDFLKLGQLYLNGGTWQGRRIVSSGWVKQSTAAQMPITEASTGLSGADFTYSPGADGFAWHRYGVRANNRRYESYEASGNGGQYLVVIPDLDLAVVLTGGNYAQGGVWRRWRDDIIGQAIVGALDEHPKR